MLIIKTKTCWSWIQRQKKKKYMNNYYYKRELSLYYLIKRNEDLQNAFISR